MKFADFKREIENNECFPIYLFEGEESFFSNRGLTLLKDKYLSEPSLNLATFDGTNFDLNEFISSINAYPFLSPKRITCITEFYPKIDLVRTKLNECFENPLPEGLLIIVNKQKCEALSKIESVRVVECVKSDAMTIARWVKAECIKRKVSIDLETAKNLADYCLCDMVRIENETHKLCDYVGDEGSIDVDDLEQMVSRDNEHKIYHMTEHIAKKQFNLAFMIIKDMLEKGSSPQMISTSIYNYFRKLLHVAISDKSTAELGKILGAQEFAVRKMKEQSLKFNKRSLKACVDYLIDADLAIKSGLTNESEQMWLSVFTIMTK